MLKPTGLAVAIALAALGFAGGASASSLVTVSGGGTWIHTVPTTTYSAPDTAFSFSFDLPEYYSPGNDPVGPGGPIGTDIGISTDFTNYTYKLGGQVIAGAPDDIAFFSVAYGGGFALAYSTISVEFYGPVDVGSSGKVIGGVYSLTPYIADQSQTYSPVNQGETPIMATIVPEPASWALALVGIGAVGVGLRSRRKIALATA